MNVNAVLNADITTVKAWLLNGFRWWVAQLRELVPPRWWTGTGRKRLIAVFDGENGFSYLRGDKKAAAPPRPGARMALAIPERFSLTRTLTVPRIGMADIRRLIDLEVERLMPLPREEALVAIDFEPPSSAPMSLTVAVAALPRAIAEKAVEAAIAAQIVPTSVMLLLAATDDVRFDFAPALRDRGMLPTRRSPALIWWSLVGVAFALNLVLLIVRDQQEVERLAGLVEQQAPAVAVARSIASRARQFEISAAMLAQRRLNHDALGALAAVSTALPAEAWVQRYAWNGQTLRLNGYKRPGVDILTALRRNTAIAHVRPTNSEVIAEIPAGQPFDLTITLRASR